MRDDVTNFSRDIEARLGGERFVWFAYVWRELSSCCCHFFASFRNASLVYCLRLHKFFRHASKNVLASLTAGKQRTACSPNGLQKSDEQTRQLMSTRGFVVTILRLNASQEDQVPLVST